MRLADRYGAPVEAHFTEGELDLEPPEELAVEELGDEAILEEELDNEDVLEQDVDEDVLEASLEDLVHAGDDVGEAAGGGHLSLDSVFGDVPPLDTGGDADDDTVGGDAGSEDLEESLDLVLLERLALLSDAGSEDADEDEEVDRVLVQVRSDTIDVVEVAPCSSDEFVCRSCFLVRKRVQLVDTVAMACGDCSS